MRTLAVRALRTLFRSVWEGQSCPIHFGRKGFHVHYRTDTPCFSDSPWQTLRQCAINSASTFTAFTRIRGQTSRPLLRQDVLFWQHGSVQDFITLT